jgi:hypothetical protein
MASVYVVLKLNGKYKTLEEEGEDNKTHCFSMMAPRLFVDGPYNVDNMNGTVTNRGQLINGVTLNQYDKNKIDILVSYEIKKMHPNTIEEHKSNTIHLVGEVTIRHDNVNRVVIVPEHATVTFCATKKDLTKALTDELGKDGAKQHTDHGNKLKLINKYRTGVNPEELTSEKLFKETFFEDKNFLKVLIDKNKEEGEEEVAKQYVNMLN